MYTHTYIYIYICIYIYTYIYIYIYGYMSDWYVIRAIGPPRLERWSMGTVNARGTPRGIRSPIRIHRIHLATKIQRLSCSAPTTYANQATWDTIDPVCLIRNDEKEKEHIVSARTLPSLSPSPSPSPTNFLDCCINMYDRDGIVFHYLETWYRSNR